MTEYTWEEVAKHNTTESLWIVVDNKVHDLTQFLEDHPGGIKPLKYFAGKDATNKFKSITAHQNSETLSEFIKTLFIGTVVTEDETVNAEE